MKQSLIDKYINNQGKDISLQGFTSTSTIMDAAVIFSFFNATEELLPVLLHIKFKLWDNYPNHFRLNSSHYSSYPKENEVMLIDGLAMKVENVN